MASVSDDGGGTAGAPVAATPVDPFNAEEKTVFDRLRARLVDMKDDPLAADFLGDNSVLWRYYTAHADGECPGPEDKIEDALDAAEEMFRGSVAWRHENNIDAMWERWRTHKDVSKRSYFCQLGSLAFYGSGHIADDARTITGGPLIYERLGKVDVAGILGDAEVKAAVTEAYIMSLETAWRATRACGGKVRATMVLDLKGLGWSFLSNAAFIKEIAKIGPPNYPEITEKIVAVRGPWVLKAIWAMISPLLPRRTREKVKVCSGNWLDKLAAIAHGGVPALPDFLGGNKTEEEHMICPALKVAEVRELVQQKPDEAPEEVPAAVPSSGAAAASAP